MQVLAWLWVGMRVLGCKILQVYIFGRYSAFILPRGSRNSHKVVTAATKAYPTNPSLDNNKVFRSKKMVMK